MAAPNQLGPLEEQAFEAVGLVTIELEIFLPIYPLSLATLQFLKSFFPAPFESIVFSVMSRPQRYCVLDACRRPLKNQQRFHLKSVFEYRAASVAARDLLFLLSSRPEAAKANGGRGRQRGTGRGSMA